MGTGRKQIELRKIEKLQNRRVTFTKRRQGMIKKAEQLSSLTGCRVAALFFSPSCMNPFLHGDLSLLEQAATVLGSSTDYWFQEQSPIVDQESLMLLTANYQEERCCRQELLLQQMDPAGILMQPKPLQMAVVPNNYHSASSHYSKNNTNYGYGAAGDQMKMLTWEVGSSSRNTTSSNFNLADQQQQESLTAYKDQEIERQKVLRMDPCTTRQSGSNNYYCNNYHYSCIEKNIYGAGASRDMGMLKWEEVGSSSSNSTTNIINNANGLMNEEEAHHQHQPLPLAGDDMAGS